MELSAGSEDLDANDPSRIDHAWRLLGVPLGRATAALFQNKITWHRKSRTEEKDEQEPWFSDRLFCCHFCSARVCTDNTVASQPQWRRSRLHQLELFARCGRRFNRLSVD